MKCQNFNGPVLMRKGGMVGPGFQKWGPGGVCIHTSGSAFDVGGPLSTPLESIAFDAPGIIEIVFKSCIEADVAVSPYGIEVEISDDGGQTWTPVAVSAVITEPAVTLTITPGVDLGDVARVTYTGPGLAYCDTGEPVQDFTVYVDAPAVLALNCAGPVYPINAVAFSHLLRASGGWPPLVYSQAVPDLPTGLLLNGTTGEISGTTAVVGVTSHDFLVTDDESNTAPCTLSMEVVEPLEITLAVLPDAQVDGSYLESITYTGGKSPYVFSIVAGTLPSDFVLQEDGSIGTALVTSPPGDYDFTAGITDESGQLDEQAYTLTIEIALSLNCADIHLNHAYVGVPYSQFAQANYGTPPYVYSLEAGTLPGDLTLNASTGEVAGLDPATVSQNALTIRVTDDDLDYTECIPTLQVWEVLNITTTSLPDGVLDSAYSEQLAATGGDTPITWTLVSGTLPPGLSISSSGLISGTCGSTEATYNFTVQASSADGQTDNQALTMDVSDVQGFVFVVETTAPNETFTLPCGNAGVYNADFDWGDGVQNTITSYLDPLLAHEYADAGLHEITVTGSLPWAWFNNVGDKLKIKEVKNWGDVGQLNCRAMFRGCTELVVTATGNAYTSQVTDMSYMFENNASQISPPDTSGFDTGMVTTMASMWSGCSGMTSAPDTAGWDVSNVESFDRFMLNCAAMVSAPDTSDWNTAKVTVFAQMFRGNTLMTECPDTSGWDTGEALDISFMFSTCSAMLTAPVVSGWNTSKCLSFRETFRLLTAAGTVDIAADTWDVGAGTNFTNMFYQTTLTTACYDRILAAWAGLTVTSTQSFHGGFSKYTDAASRLVLTDPPNSWTIVDGGPA